MSSFSPSRLNWQWQAKLEPPAPTPTKSKSRSKSSKSKSRTRTTSTSTSTSTSTTTTTTTTTPLPNLKPKRRYGGDMNTNMGETSEKAHDRNRVNYWVQLITKIINKSGRKPSPDDVHQIRYATSKLHQIIQPLERSGKDAIVKQSNLVDTLITVLQLVSCEYTMSNTINVFIEVAGKTQVAKRASIMINNGLTTVLLQMLKLHHSNDAVIPEDTLLSIHILLSRIGFKDRKLAVKARLYQSLLVTVNLIKSHLHHFRNLQPLLQVLRIYTNNSVNASYLGKHNTVSLMFKVITACGKRHTVDLKLALENLNNLTKSKSNSARLIGMGGVPQLLLLHSEWQLLDTKHRNLNIQKGILKILKNITNLKSGRKSFAEADGIRTLYTSACEANDCREMESLILLASVILRKCYPRNKLPIDHMFSPKLYPLPTSATHTPECYFLPGYPIPHGMWGETVNSADSDHSSLDEDDDIDSDDERFRTDNDEPDEEQWDGLEPAEKRAPDELRMYDTFFPELFDTEFSGPSTILSLQRSASETSCSHSRFTNMYSDNLKMRTESSPSLSYYKRTSLDFTTTPRFFQAQQYQPQPLSALQVSIPESQAMDKTVSAINLKTGASVISFDLGPKSSSALPSAKPSIKALPKGKTKKRSSQCNMKEKKSKKSAGKLEDSLTDSLSSISLPSNLEVDDSDQATLSSNEELDDELSEYSHDNATFSQMAPDTHSTYRFEKLAFPDLHGVKATKQAEALLSRKFGVQRLKIFEDIDRMIHPEYVIDRVVYDLDQIIKDAKDEYKGENSNLANRDELRVGNLDNHFGSLKFHAQFECGNLRKAIQVREHEYDLILNPDINSNHHHQWFYFEVSNMQAGVPYRFNIVNCEKLNSQFNFGMQPLMMSVMEATKGNPAWVRTGSDICYYKNHYIRHPHTTGGVKGKSYYTATFTLTFPHAGDICYLSYHYPYSYTMLKMHIKQWEKHHDSSAIYFRSQSLCNTLGGNSVPVLTITAQPRSNDKDSLEEFRSRPYIFLSGRVHPGESNASWIMKGTIDFLMSRKSQAQLVREMYIFKIVPMLNPDGVLNGNHRSSLVGEDLNRRWAKPCPILHGPIYHTKGLLLYLNMVNKIPMVYCDYHGHSRRKNIFLYGCSPSQSWIPNDTQNPCVINGKGLNDSSFKALPRLLHSNIPCFCLQNCSYVVERVKETTARVVVWRHIGVVRSYTMESSYCGCDQGKHKDMHINTILLEEMGHKFCETLIKLGKQKGNYDQQQPVFDIDLNSTSLEEMGSIMEAPGHTAESDDEDDEDEEEEEFDDDM